MLGKQRLGVNLVSLIATLREEARLPIGAIQWYLRTVHGLRLSAGAIVSAIHQTAQQAQAAVAQILAQIRASPVVHADETGWREDGHNGYVWTFSTPSARYLSAAEPQQSGGGRGVGRPTPPACWSATSTPLTITMTARYNAAGYTCCGTSTTCVLSTPMMRHWRGGLTPSTGFMTGPKPAPTPGKSGGARAQLALERQLLAICQPFLDDPSTTPAKLCRRIQRHIKSLFVFVAEPEAPADNNAAERSRRHLVVSRKISGGTRSERGTASKMTLASLFGTWRVQGLNPLDACRQLLTTPQV